MSSLGKVFIFEKNLNHLKKYQRIFSKIGFFTFSTDNLYLLLQYTKEVHPDIVIINIPNSVFLTENNLHQLEKNLCNKQNCPHIYINQILSSENNPHIHQWNFETEDLSYEQILQIIKHSNSKNDLN